MELILQNICMFLNRMLRNFLLPMGFCLLVVPCNSPYVSKKRGYFNIELPNRSYQKFDKEDFPYSFEYPVYARIIQDSTYFDTNPENPYWFNIDFPQFHSRIFLLLEFRFIGTHLYS